MIDDILGGVLSHRCPYCKHYLTQHKVAYGLSVHDALAQFCCESLECSCAIHYTDGEGGKIIE